MLYGMKLFDLNLLEFEKNDYKVARQIITTDGWMANISSSKLEQIENENFNDVHFKLSYMIKDLIYAFEEIYNRNDIEIENLVNNYKIKEKDYGDFDFSIIARRKIK